VAGPRLSGDDPVREPVAVHVQQLGGVRRRHFASREAPLSADRGSAGWRPYARPVGRCSKAIAAGGRAEVRGPA
jgi:hypothetical protein